MPQSLSNVLLHVIFSTKSRTPFIDSPIQEELYGYMIAIASTYESFVHKIGGVEDHVHLCLTLPRTISTSDLLEEIKKKSSKWIKSKGKNYHDFAWQRGFGAFSVSESQTEAVVAYISNQKEHHKIFFSG